MSVLPNRQMEHKWRDSTKRYWLRIMKRYHYRVNDVCKVLKCSTTMVKYYCDKFDIDYHALYEQYHHYPTESVSRKRAGKLRQNRQKFEQVLNNCNGDVDKAAEILGLRPEQIRKLGRELEVEYKRKESNWRLLNASLSLDLMADEEYKNLESDSNWACQILGV